MIRVFPRRTEATPDDELAFTDSPPMWELPSEDIHISVAFTYDKNKAEELAFQWEPRGKVTIGGPAYGDKGDVFVPGRYLKNGYVITSRGCPNNCWFCDVHRREGDIRELPITEGWNLLDSNILACSDEHIRKVFAMLSRQKNPVEFTGGLEAKILKPWHVDLLWGIRPKQMFFAYDTPDDHEPLVEAGKMLRMADFTRGHLRCYVLIGHPKDSMAEAEKRLMQTWEAGFLPMAMLWKNKAGDEDKEWRKFQRSWARPAITKRVVRDIWRERLGEDNE